MIDKINLKDIISEQDIKILIDSFYKKVVDDPVIGFIFTDVVTLSWEKHIPIMYSFWGSVLLGGNSYSGNPMTKHIALDTKISLTKVHFDRWLWLWESTIRENFIGIKAEEAITRAKNIAGVMLYKIEESRR